jgi:hypothetical protein
MEKDPGGSRGGSRRHLLQYLFLNDLPGRYNRGFSFLLAERGASALTLASGRAPSAAAWRRIRPTRGCDRSERQDERRTTPGHARRLLAPSPSPSHFRCRRKRLEPPRPKVDNPRRRRAPPSFIFAPQVRGCALNPAFAAVTLASTISLLFAKQGFRIPCSTKKPPCSRRNSEFVCNALES